MPLPTTGLPMTPGRNTSELKADTPSPDTHKATSDLPLVKLGILPWATMTEKATEAVRLALAKTPAGEGSVGAKSSSSMKEI